MKNRLFNNDEMPTQLAHNLLEDSQLNAALRHIGDNCLEHNVSLRDAHNLVQQQVMLVFSSYLLSSLHKVTITPTQITETQTHSLSFTQMKLLTNNQT